MLLKDNHLQQELKNNGFVILPFLNAQELQQLNDFYAGVHGNEEPPLFIEDIHMTTWCSDAGYKQSISDNLTTIFAQASNRFFQNYRRLNNVFIVKRSGRQTSFKVHQDWNIVDENLYESVNVWVPLHDVSEDSGALWVLKGSHNIQRKVRGAGYLFPDYGPHLAELEKKAISVNLKAGEAIVFYHSVIHGSPPNLSGALRRAACFSVIPKQAPLCIYFQPTANHALEQHEPPDGFMFNYTHLRTETTQRAPSEQPVKQMPSFTNKKVELAELHPFLKEKRGIFSFFRK